MVDSFEVSSSEPLLSQGKAWSSVICLLRLLQLSFSLYLIPLFLFLFFPLHFTSVVSHCLTDTSTRGVAMVPKLALDVMSCEVMRVLQLTDSCIVPISYQVPRKVCIQIHNNVRVISVLWCFSMCCVVFQHSGQEFHDDLYPDTVGTTPGMSAEEWWQGGNKQVK